MSLLRIKNLNAWYTIQVLHDVTMHVDSGEIVSVIGPNGAGKSTVLKSVFGLVDRREGTIEFNSKDIAGFDTHHIVRSGISYVPQGRSIFPKLTVRENLELGSYIQKNVDEIQLLEVYKHFPILKQRENQKAGLLSGGEQQMVAIGRALMIQPKLIILDEPTLGLAPAFKKLIFDKILEINKAGVSIFMVEQNAHMSLKMSHRAYVLELGRNKFAGTGKELLSDDRVQKLYLGGG